MRDGIPRAPRRFLERPRLHDLLDNDSPLTVVRGPRGFGKTALLGEWARAVQPRRAVLWVAGGPRSDRDILAGLTGHSVTTASVDELVDGFAAAGPELDIVIDDADAVDEDAADILLAALAASPGTRFVVSSRSRSPFDAPERLLRFDAVEIDPSVLRFTGDETEAYLLAAGVPGAHGVASLVQTVTAGSALEVFAAMRALESSAPPRTARELGAHVARSLRSTLFPAEFVESSPELMPFLRAAAASEQLDARLAVALAAEASIELDATRAADLLDQTVAAGLGWWEPASESPVFRFALGARLSLDAEARDAEGVHRRKLLAIDWALDHERTLGAFRLALEIGDLDLASDIARDDFRQLMLGHPRDVRDLLSGLPAGALGAHPLLSLLLAVIFNARHEHRARAVELLVRAVLGAHRMRRSSSPADRIAIRSLEAVGYRVIGAPERGAKSAREALAAIVDLEDGAVGRFAAQLPMVLAQNGITLYYAGDVEHALEAFRLSASLPVLHDSLSMLHGLSLEAGAIAFGGDMPAAERAVRTALAHDWPDDAFVGYSGTFLQLARAWIALEGGDAHEARDILALLDGELATTEHWAAILCVRAMIAVHDGSASETLEYIRAERRRRRGRRQTSAVMRTALDVAESNLLLASGRPGPALDVLANSSRDPRVATAIARAALVSGDVERAASALARVSAAPHSTRIGLEIDAIAAALVARGVRDAPEGGARALIDALAENGLRSPLVLLPTEDRELLLGGLDPATRARRADYLAVVMPDVVHRSAIPALTERERVVLRALFTTSSVTEIAATLVVSVNTVKSQRRSLYRKLGVSTREEALARARLVLPEAGTRD
ncbi:LuxR C-terminal-related transcriptional regulator [Agromyces atrinae]|uniref:LuxR C-terminal-related transcriptional regulator n=1 Tax=Agromyces atrinae TaxID=592376 RepID=UPI001F55C4FF|nr:LuxR C-terminal-related transcriptional regulator [Agromyces atrinae]MCI2956456.1 LuxR C-terminal-related transcriptional regulator [Agromyces atrinae]